MMDKSDRDDRIADLLAAYGSDVSRWPVDGQAAMAALSSKDRAAVLREEAALDDLIAKAEATSANAPAPADLMARILAAVPEQETRGKGAPGPALSANEAKEPSARVVELRGAARKPAAIAGHVARPKREWAAAGALLAASLVLGLYVGSTDQGRNAARSVGELAGIDVSAQSVQITALDEALQTPDDEEFL